jgi:hypothetical protein
MPVKLVPEIPGFFDLEITIKGNSGAGSRILQDTLLQFLAGNTIV